MTRALYFALVIASTAYAALPDGHSYDNSPSGMFLIANDRNQENPRTENHISVARRDQPAKSYRIYTYPRLVDLYFSPDERYLVIDDHNGSGSNECAVLMRIDKPPYYVKPVKVDERAWKLFWSRHHRPRKITYGHRKTYFCEWLDSSRFVVGLQGNSDFDAPKWYLDGGWHCIYDAARRNVATDKYTDSKNAQYELSID
jgi:hypothetical protein